MWLTLYGGVMPTHTAHVYHLLDRKHRHLSLSIITQSMIGLKHQR